jgi:Flp pilus assembly pilin Flp
MREELRGESGQTTVEYALLTVVALLIALLLAAVLTGALGRAFQALSDVVS